MNFNKVFLLGRLTRDPDARNLPSGKISCSFGLATRKIETKDKEKQERVEFHNIVAFDKLAEVCMQHLNQGSVVFVEGRIQTRNWQNADGEARYRTEVLAEYIQIASKAVKEPPGTCTGCGKMDDEMD